MRDNGPKKFYQAAFLLWQRQDAVAKRIAEIEAGSSKTEDEMPEVTALMERQDRRKAGVDFIIRQLQPTH